MIDPQQLHYANHWLDITIVIGYLVLMIWAGFYFRNISKNIKDYFSTSSQCPWLIAAFSFFISGFTSYMFVAASGQAFRSGVASLLMFCSAGPATVLGALYFARAWRRSRMTSPLEFMTFRFKRGTTQFFAITQVFFSMVVSGLMLTTLAVFLVPCMNIPTEIAIPLLHVNVDGVCLVITVVGLIILFYTTMGGLWAVLITDSIQTIILVVITVAVFFMSFHYLGDVRSVVQGVKNLIQKAPPEMWSLAQPEQTLYFSITYIITILMSMNATWYFIQRYGSVPTEKDAVKLAWFASVVLFLVPIVWIFPAIVARTVFGPDLSVHWPGIEAPEETSYTMISMLVLPNGLLGLIIAAMLSATMSTFSSVYNAQAAVITSDVYRPIYQGFSKKAPSERHLLWVGRLTTVTMGVVGIVMGIVYAKIPDMGIFRIGIHLNSYVYLPFLAPTLLGLVLRRSAWWAAFVGALLAIAFSLIVDYAYIVLGLFGWEIDPMAFYHWFYGVFFDRPVGDKWIDMVAVKYSFQMLLVLLTFLISIPFATQEDINRPERLQFEKNLKTPVNYEGKGDPRLRYWIFRPLGMITVIIGSFLLLGLPIQVLFPGKHLPLTGYQIRMWILIVLAFFILGGAMIHAARGKGSKAEDAESNLPGEAE